ncbi:MAG: hypothetical protein K9W44_08180 [Candidatus Lokiarchaeota archaeon]|nr:hypothetical protein [Candidatus Harpocratesius repetitus]
MIISEINKKDIIEVENVIIGRGVIFYVMNEKLLINLLNLQDPINNRLFRFLDYINRILNATKAPYVRDLVTLDYLTTTLEMDYKTAEGFLDLLEKLGIIESDQHGAFPGCFLTPKGKKILEELRTIFNNSQAKQDIIKSSSKKVFILGKTQDQEISDDSETILIKDHLNNYSEELIFRFLKFHLGVIKNAQVPYLRDLVAEDFLKDCEHLSFKQTSDFISSLVDKGILAYNQFGAFPGTTVTDFGKNIFRKLKKKIGKNENH